MSGQDRINSVGGGDIWADPARLAAIENARKILRPNGIRVISEYDPGDVIAKSPQWESLKPSFNRIGDVWKQSMFAKSDQAALQIINDLRGQINSTGYARAIKYTNENLKGKEMKKFGMPN
jgi:putative aldouronate transport system substrate-binding protein